MVDLANKAHRAELAINSHLLSNKREWNIQFQKISILPPQKGLEFPGGVRGFCKTKTFKEMYEAQSEFPEGWGGGGLRKISFRRGGMEFFWT